VNKCKWCGKSFEKSDLNKFVGGATLGIGGGEKYCSKACKYAAEDSKVSKSTNSVNSNSFTNDRDDDDKELELQEARLEHERDLEEQRQEHELKLSSIQSTNNAIERINDLDLGGINPTPELISRDVELCLTLGSSSLAETFESIGSSDEREKFNQSEKIVNVAIKKAELGINKLKLCEPTEKAMKYYSLYREQLNETKIKQINRKFDLKIKEAKPETWIWFACIFFLPAILYPIFKTYTAMFVLPKKRDVEIAKI
jgi:hypothetical protein